MALGRSKEQLKLSLTLSATTILVVAASAPFGVVAVSAALAGGTGVIWAIYLRQLSRALGMPALRMARALVPSLLGVAAMTPVLLLARRLLAGAPPAALIALLVALGALVYGAVIVLLARKRLTEDARTFARAQADSAPPAAAAAAAEAETAATLA
jgi:hypothetical protein